MPNEKPITVTMAGTGTSHEVAVEPDDRPEDVLLEVVEDGDAYTLRQADGEPFDPDTRVHDSVDAGEVTFAATRPVVGRAEPVRPAHAP